jgi:uncharacterized repeat protein (TIGR01451 family)
MVAEGRRTRKGTANAREGAAAFAWTVRALAVCVGLAGLTSQAVAEVSLSKNDGTSFAVAGGTVTWVITVTESQGLEALGVTVTDTFPAACTAVTWTSVALDGASGNTPAGSGNLAETVDLPPNASVSYFATCDISASASGTLSNTASAVGPNQVSATDDDTITPGTDLAITKSNGSTGVVDGSTTHYVIDVTNQGATAITGASVTDNFPPQLTGCTWGCSVLTPTATCPASGGSPLVASVDLGPGAAVRFDVDCTVNAGSESAVTNTATVAPPQGVTDVDSSDDSATDVDQVLGAAEADLSITKDDEVTYVSPGGSVTYVITAVNGGPFQAAALVSDNFPGTCSSVTYSSVAVGGATGNTNGAGAINDNLDLPAGGGVTYSATCVVSGAAPAGPLVNVATISLEGGQSISDPVAGNNSATDTDTIVLGAALDASKAVAGTFVPGGTVTYTVVLTNNGAGAQGDNPGDEFTDILPASLVLQSASASSGAALATPGTNTVTWNGAIAAGGGSVTIAIQAQIAAGATGVVSNQGTVSFDSDGEGTHDANIPTDDPAIAGAANPTVFSVGGTIAIPALSEIGLLGLAAALGGLAVRKLRR